MSQVRVPPALGKYATGAEFWDRDQEIEDLTRLIQNGESFVLTGQRRLGKSSLIKQTASRLGPDFRFVDVDLQDAHSPKDFVVKLALAAEPFHDWQEKIRGAFGFTRDLIEGINFMELGVQLRARVPSEWDNEATRIVGIMTSTPQKVFIAFDEVPIFLTNLLSNDDPANRADHERFLRWISATADNVSNKVSISLTGSIGLTPILERLGTSSYSRRFIPYKLKPWTGEICESFLEARAHYEGVVWDDGARETFMKLIGLGIPHYIQRFFHASCSECREDNRSGITIEDVEQAYHQRMLGSLTDLDLSNYYERITRVLGPDDTPFAIELLTETAVRGILTHRTLEAIGELKGYERFGKRDFQQFVLRFLVHDGYLSEENRSYRFAFKLLRDWWKNRYGRGYVPIMKRWRAR